MFDSSFRYGDSSFRRFGTPIYEVDSAKYQFDSSAGLLCRSVVSSFRHVVSSFRHVVSLWRFVVSTRPLREAIIRRTYMKCLLDSMHSYMTYLSVICYVPTEKGFFEELPTAQHRIRVKSSESMSGFMKVKMKPDV